MLKWSAAALVAIVLFGLVFALLPGTTRPQDRTGVRLRGVSLRLYPAQDPNAEWRFQAPDLAFDPVKEEATITGLERGERWARPPVDAQHPAQPLGLDLTLRTQQLTIDANDNIRTKEANIYLPRDCWSLDLRSNPAQQVLIDQNQGISAPAADIHSPAYNGQFSSVNVSFDLSRSNLVQEPGATVNPSPDVECVSGQIIPRTRR